MKPGVTSSSQRTYVALRVHGRLLRTDAGVGYFNNMLQLPGLLLDLSCQEQRSLGNDLYRETGERKKPLKSVPSLNMATAYGAADTYISVEFREGVNHIKPVHIYYSCVYNQLRSGDGVKAKNMDNSE